MRSLAKSLVLFGLGLYSAQFIEEYMTTLVAVLWILFIVVVILRQTNIEIDNLYKGIHRD